MSNFFTNEKDVKYWVNKVGLEAYDILIKLPCLQPFEVDIKETVDKIVKDNDEIALTALYQVMVKSGLSNPLMNLDKKISGESMNNKLKKKAFHQIEVVPVDMPTRVCPKRMGKSVVSTFNCRHYCSESIVLDDNPDKVYCGEVLWRQHVMDRFSSEQHDKNGTLVGGYINDRFYRFPDASTPEGPETARDHGNSMSLSYNERQKEVRPHQWSVEKQMEEKRKAVKTANSDKSEKPEKSEDFHDNEVTFSKQELRKQTHGEKSAIKVYSMLIDLKNKGVTNEEALLYVTNKTQMPSHVVALLQESALRKLASSNNTLYKIANKEVKNQNLDNKNDSKEKDEDQDDVMDAELLGLNENA